MGRIEKLKREAINEANIRVLNEQESCPTIPNIQIKHDYVENKYNTYENGSADIEIEEDDMYSNHGAPSSASDRIILKWNNVGKKYKIGIEEEQGEKKEEIIKGNSYTAIIPNRNSKYAISIITLCRKEESAPFTFSVITPG